MDLPGLGQNFQWTVRYAKEYPNSLETLWTKATHLVTHIGASATEPGNLNFVFSTASAIEEQWDHYYRTVPILLYYFVAIAEEVASRFVVWDEALRPTQRMMRDLAIMRFSHTYTRSPDVDELPDQLLGKLDGIGFDCECGGEVTVGTSGVDRFWLTAQMICPACGKPYSVWDLLKEAKTSGNA